MAKTRDKIVDQLRELANDVNGISIQLPFEMTHIMKGDAVEVKFCEIQTVEVLSYIADMIEE